MLQTELSHSIRVARTELLQTIRGVGVNWNNTIIPPILLYMMLKAANWQLRIFPKRS